MMGKHAGDTQEQRRCIKAVDAQLNRREMRNCGRRKLACGSGRYHNVANLVNVMTYLTLAYKRHKAGLRFSSFLHAVGYHGGNARVSVGHSLFWWERPSFV